MSNSIIDNQLTYAKPEPIKLTTEQRSKAFVKNTVAKFNHRRKYGQQQNNVDCSHYVVSICTNNGVLL